MSRYKYKRIFIIGHPGAGKALVAKTLAERLGWKFVDADLGLEFHIGRTVKQIFGKEGEEAFYHCQSEILANLIHQENIVVTTDASIICAEKTKKLLLTEFIVYLQVSTAVQVERLSHHPVPLLPVPNVKPFLDKLHNERDNLYAQIADFTINGDNSALEAHVLSIIKIISED